MAYDGGGGGGGLLDVHESTLLRLSVLLLGTPFKVRCLLFPLRSI